MAETLLPLASATIGVISPPGIDTATEMSARLYLISVSPAKLTLHSGTSISAAASALISRSLTLSLMLRLASPALSSRAQLEQRVELDVDGQIDVRDLLLRLGQPARDGLAHVARA